MKLLMWCALFALLVVWVWWSERHPAPPSSEEVDTDWLDAYGP